MFKLSNFNQIGILVRDIEKTKNFMEEIFDFKSKLNIIEQETEAIYKGKKVNFRLKKIHQNFGDKQLEIVEVIDSNGDHIYSDYLKKDKVGLHHLGIFAKNAEELKDHFKKKYGINAIQEGKVGKIKFYYLDTVSILGFIVELISL